VSPVAFGRSFKDRQLAFLSNLYKAVASTLFGDLSPKSRFPTAFGSAGAYVASQIPCSEAMPYLRDVDAAVPGKTG
jgi:hypothetical protein